MLLRSYFSKIKKYGISSSATCSGLACIAFFHSLHYLEGNKKRMNRRMKRRMIDFVLLYLLVDYKIDDPSISYEEKREFLLILLERENANLIPPHLIKMYTRLTSSSSTIFLPILLTTAESFLIQYSEEATASDLFNICVNKGGQAVLIGYRLIYESSYLSDDQLLILGACIQLVDDIIDCSKDRREGIVTIATYCAKEYRYLDRLILILIYLLEELVHPLEKQKEYLFLLLRRIIDRSSHFSPRLRQSLGYSRYK